MKPKSVFLTVYVAVLLSGCGGSADDIAGAMRAFVSACKGQVQAELTTGKWNSQMVMRCNDFGNVK